MGWVVSIGKSVRGVCVSVCSSQAEGVTLRSMGLLKVCACMLRVYVCVLCACIYGVGYLMVERTQKHKTHIHISRVQFQYIASVFAQLTSRPHRRTRTWDDK